MNCEQARVLIGAEPNASTSELAEHLRECQDCGALQTEMIALDTHIRRALEQRPLPLRAAAPQAQRRRDLARHWRPWAAAASVLGIAAAVAIGWLLRPADTLAHDLTQHVIAESHSWDSRASVDAGTLESVFRKAGVALDVRATPVVYARSCWFRGHWVPHLVVQTATGPVTVLALPAEQVRRRTSFHEEGLSGLIVPAEHGSLALLTQDPQRMDALAAQVRMRALPASGP
jgi:hypothetical protein